VVDEIERLLGQSLNVARRQELLLDARVTGDAEAGYAVRLQVTTSAGAYERNLRHTDCGKLAEGAALVMALAIDPERVAARGASEPPEEDSPPETAAPAEPPPPAPEPTPADEPSEQGGDVGLFALAGAGVLPSSGAGLALDVGFRSGSHFRLAVVGSYWFPRTKEIPEQEGAAIRLRLWTAGLRGCWLPGSGEIELSVCLGPEAGRVTGEGRGVEDSSSEADWHSALILGGGAALAVAEPLWIAAGVEGGPVLGRPRFGVEEWDGDYQAEPWTLRALIGALVRLP
jgi:hypothetical protein